MGLFIQSMLSHDLHAPRDFQRLALLPQPAGPSSGLAAAAMYEASSETGSNRGLIQNPQRENYMSERGSSEADSDDGMGLAMSSDSDAGESSGLLASDSVSEGGGFCHADVENDSEDAACASSASGLACSEDDEDGRDDQSLDALSGPDSADSKGNSGPGLSTSASGEGALRDLSRPGAWLLDVTYTMVKALCGDRAPKSTRLGYRVVSNEALRWLMDACGVPATMETDQHESYRTNKMHRGNVVECLAWCALEADQPQLVVAMA